VCVEKVVALSTSRDRAISEPGLEARTKAAEAGRFAELFEAHRRAWHHLWEDFDLELELEPGCRDEAQLRLRLHVFHLLQTVSLHSTDLDVGVPARGWHGEAYRGHIFWDELFIFPILDLRLPVLTRAVLRYRHRRLPEARRMAREAGFAGAMFPWQSGSSGREESQTLHLNPESGRWLPDPTHRQRHIGSAVAYNVWHYFQVTEDFDFLFYYGAEMMLEIARFWASAARYDEASDRYEIRGVMGPDEYHTAYPDADPASEGGLDNNAYTNVMAAWVLVRARDVLDLLPERRCRKLREHLGISPEEIEHWEDVSRKLRVCFHDDGIISQFEGYETLEEFDWEGYGRRYGDIQRLDRILEAEGDTPNRYKVSKQADVLMLFYLFSAEELAWLFEHMGYPFPPDLIPRNIAYYLDRTSHGSTLSFVTHAWVLARSDRPASWRLFCDALGSDVDDIQGGTTREGIHVGAMAGTVDLLHRCYSGIEVRANVLHFDPCLPWDLRRLRFQLRYRRQLLKVEVTRDTLEVGSHPFTANPITIAYRGRYRNLSPGDRYRFRLLTPAERDRKRHREEPSPRDRLRSRPHERS
jgi:alpha,alpha-trehalase